MAEQSTKVTAEVHAAARLFSSPSALAFVRRAVAGGLPQAEARKRYLNFINRSDVPHERRAA